MVCAMFIVFLLFLLCLGGAACWLAMHGSSRHRKLLALGVNFVAFGMAMGLVSQANGPVDTLMGILGAVAALALFIKSL